MFYINILFTGEKLHRSKDVCCNKHKSVMRTKMNKGEYSEAEEGVIVKRVNEWAEKGGE